MLRLSSFLNARVKFSMYVVSILSPFKWACDESKRSCATISKWRASASRRALTYTCLCFVIDFYHFSRKTRLSLRNSDTGIVDGTAKNEDKMRKEGKKREKAKQTRKKKLLSIAFFLELFSLK